MRGSFEVGRVYADAYKALEQSAWLRGTCSSVTRNVQLKVTLFELRVTPFEFRVAKTTNQDEAFHYVELYVNT